MDWVIVAATVVIALSALMSLWLNWRLSQDNRTLRKIATKPEVVAYLGESRQSPYLIDLVLENVGQGPALDVSYLVEADASDFIKHEVRNLPVGTKRKISSLLPQGESVRRTMGVGNALYSESSEDRLGPFSIRIWYSSLRSECFSSQKFELDILEIGGMAMVQPSEAKSAESLEKIERHLDHVVSGFKRVHVETITTSERKQ